MNNDSTNRGNEANQASRIADIVSQRLRSLCEKNEMSKYRLYQLTGVTQTNLANYISGKSLPSLLSLEKISRAFGMTPAQFLSEDGLNIEQSQEQRGVAELWGELNLEHRALVLRTIQGLLLAEQTEQEQRSLPQK